MAGSSWLETALTGNRFSASTRRNPLTRLLEAVGTDEEGKLNSPAKTAGVVNSYLAAAPYRDQIANLIDAATAAGKLAPQTGATVRRGFKAADQTRQVGDQLADYIDSALPKRRQKIDTSSYTPPSGALNLQDLARHPADVMGAPQQSQLLSVPGTFDFNDFSSRMTPERIRAMHTAALAGGPIGGPYWYNMAPIYEKFAEIYGPTEGAARFQAWAHDNAALSPRSGVVDQTIRESQINYLLNKTGEYPTNADLKGAPDMYGHIAHDAHVANMSADDLVKTGDKPKIGSYYQNYLGNWLPGTMDVHHFSIAGLSEPGLVALKRRDPVTGSWVPKLGPDGAPLTNQTWIPIDKYYTPLELATSHLAGRFGVDPAALQASVWTGLAQRPDLLPMGKKFAPRTSAPYAAIFDEVLRNSADIRGKTPDQMFADAMNRDDYLTRAAGAAKTRTNAFNAADSADPGNEFSNLDALDGYAGGGLVNTGLGALTRLFTKAAEPHYAVKTEGGNWLANSIPDVLRAVQHGPAREQWPIRIPEAAQQQWNSQHPADAALNTWVSKQLTNYHRNQLGTANDPVLKMLDAWPAQRDEQVAKQQAIVDRLSQEISSRQAQGLTSPTETAAQRAAQQEIARLNSYNPLHIPLDEWVPEYIGDQAAANRRAGKQPLTNSGVSPLAQRWSEYADANIQPRPASTLPLADRAANPFYQTLATGTPEQRNTPVHRLSFDAPEELGWRHLIDELHNATSNFGEGQQLRAQLQGLRAQQAKMADPSSLDGPIADINERLGQLLPPHLQLNPAQLSRLDVPGAIKRVADINDYRRMLQVQADAQKANNAATQTVREYAENNPRGLRWVELKANDQLPEGYSFSPIKNGIAVRDSTGRAITSASSEAEALRAFQNTDIGSRALQDALTYEGETMQHCVGGYCDRVLNGESRIFSLRDQDGRPHVTIETKPNDEGEHTVTQVFGPRDERPADEHQPFITDFIRRNGFSVSNTPSALENTDLIDPTTIRPSYWGAQSQITNDMLRELGRIFPDKDANGWAIASGPYGVRRSGPDLMQRALQVKPTGHAYVTPDELAQHLGTIEPQPIEAGFAPSGGAFRDAVEDKAKGGPIEPETPYAPPATGGVRG